MQRNTIQFPGAVAIAALAVLGTPAWAVTTIQVGASGKTFASSMVDCADNPDTGIRSPVVQAGLFNPKRDTSAEVLLNGISVSTVTTAAPSTDVWLAAGSSTVVVSLSKKTADSYAFSVTPDRCAVNTFSADGTLEYGWSGQSYATVTPGCAFNARTGRAQPFVNLFLNGTYVLNVSVNGTPLTQLSPSRPHTPVFLGPGSNVISAATNTVVSPRTDYYERDGGDGTCQLP